MIRHKPSEKMPANMHFVVVKMVLSKQQALREISGNWSFGFWDEYAQVWRLFKTDSLGLGADVYGRDKVEWWADPMEEE